MSLARGFPKKVTQDNGWSRQGNETEGVWEGRANNQHKGTRKGTPVSMPCRAGRPEQPGEIKPGGSKSHARLKGFPSAEL